MIDCEKFEEMISARLDGELSPEDERLLQAHLDKCPSCRAMAEVFSAVSKASRKSVDVPAGLHESIMSAVKSAAAEKASGEAASAAVGASGLTGEAAKAPVSASDKVSDAPISVSGDAKKAANGSKNAKKGRLIRLRPTVVAAACCVVIVAALLGGMSAFWRMGASSSSGAAPDMIESLAAPAEVPNAVKRPEPASGDTSEDTAGGVFTATSGASEPESGSDGDGGVGDSNGGELEAAQKSPGAEVLLDLDIRSAHLITSPSGGDAEADLSGYDAKLWLASLVSENLSFAESEKLADISYEFDYETGEKSETVYFFYESGELRASRNPDRSESWPIDSAQTLKDFIEY